MCGHNATDRAFYPEKEFRENHGGKNKGILLPSSHVHYREEWKKHP